MAITYPLTMPTITSMASINLRAVNGTIISRSPFTFKEQVQNFGAARWEADISLPPMKRAAAETWIAWLMSLKGQRGTFYLGDPTATTPRGSAGASDTPAVRATPTSGNDTLYLDGLPNSITGYLKAGDYVQLGDSGDNQQHLHKVLQDVNTNASGQATLYIWPNIRRNAHKQEDYDKIYFHNAKGVFRLLSNQVSWDINRAQTFGLTFSCVESIETDIAAQISP